MRTLSSLYLENESRKAASPVARGRRDPPSFVLVGAVIRLAMVLDETWLDAVEVEDMAAVTADVSGARGDNVG